MNASPPETPEMELSVAGALAGRRVLITGTTGFIAKLVLEKLVREVPGITRYVLLLRGNSTFPDAAKRFEAEVLGSSVFDHLRRSDPHRLRDSSKRMTVVSGEISAPNFGLCDTRFADLAKSVDVIINVAASVDFREALDQALAINTLSLVSLARLARMAGKVPLVQVSTCYVNGYRRGSIPEQLAPPTRLRLPRHVDGLVDVAGLLAGLQAKVAALKRAVEDPVAQRAALVRLGMREAQRCGWNDTYTFTKWLGEQVAARAMAGGTLSMVRPSIVESAWREPQPGWVEGMKVGDAIVLAYARGKTTLFPARPAGIADIMPADLVANSIILATAQALARPGRQRIVQAASGSRNPVRVGDYIRLCQTEMRDNSAAYPKLIRQPLTRPFRTVPRGLFIAWLGAAYGLMKAANHVQRWLGASANPAAFDALETTRQLALTFSFYTSPRCVFDNRELLAMAGEFTPDDRQRFEVDPLCFDWPTYVAKVHLPGLERHAVKAAPPTQRRVALLPLPGGEESKLSA